MQGAKGRVYGVEERGPPANLGLHAEGQQHQPGRGVQQGLVVLTKTMMMAASWW